MYAAVYKKLRATASRFLRSGVDFGQAYEGSGNDRATKQWRASQLGPDSEILWDLQTLRERSRDLWRNTDVGYGIISPLVSNVVGRGLKLQANIDRDALGLSEDEAAEWEDNVERRFKMWAETKEADARRRCNFYMLQELAYKTMLKSGDSFALLPMIRRPGSLFKLRVKIIEADDVQDPRGTFVFGSNIRGGIEMGKHGEPVRIWVRQREGLSSRYKSIDFFGKASGRQNVIQLYKEDRPGQSRGVPMLARVLRRVKQLHRYDDAELAAAVVNSFYSVFIESEYPDAINSGAAALLKKNNIGDDDPNQDDFDYELAPGAIMQLRPGEKINSANPMRPNSAHEPFSNTMIRNMGMGTDVPFEIIVKQFGGSYSASRGIMLMFWKYVLKERDFLALNFCQPIYTEWLTDEVLSGGIQAPGFLDDRNMRAAWLGASWVGDAMGQIDPVKETTAAIMRINNGLSTRSEETMAINGGDFRSNARRLRRESEIIGDILLQSQGKVIVQMDGNNANQAE